MSTAHSTLEALLVYQNVDPVIRHFVLITKAFLESKNLEGREATALMCIREELATLEKRLTNG